MISHNSRQPKLQQTRALLRSRAIVSVIPEPSDQIGHRKRRGSRGGRAVTYDSDAHRGRNVIERSFNLI